MKLKLTSFAGVAKALTVFGGAFLVGYGLSKCSEKFFSFALEKASKLAFK